MQVRDLIEELKQYPEDWPVAYQNRGEPIPIEVKRSEGYICPTGTKSDKYGGWKLGYKRQFVAIKGIFTK